MKTYYLIDYTHGKKQIWMDRLYETASKIAVKYGSMGHNMQDYKEKYIREFWTYNTDYPSCKTLKEFVRVKSIKWFIYNKLDCKDEIWNPDFLHGLAIHGKIRWSKCDFPSFWWHCNTSLNKLIMLCPFGGKIKIVRKGVIGRWMSVPALYLKYSKDTASFAAGIMAGGTPVVIKGVGYARFKNNAFEHIKQFRVPIEFKTISHFYISPIWPALFSLKMPEEIRQEWLDIPHPCNANIYAPILWKAYINSKFQTEGIPFLKSRRSLFYEFSCEEGAMERLDKLRVEKDLTELDNQVIDMVRIWSQRNAKQHTEPANVQQ